MYYVVNLDKNEYCGKDFTSGSDKCEISPGSRIMMYGLRHLCKGKEQNPFDTWYGDRIVSIKNGLQEAKLLSEYDPLVTRGINFFEFVNFSYENVIKHSVTVQAMTNKFLVNLDKKQYVVIGSLLKPKTIWPLHPLTIMTADAYAVEDLRKRTADPSFKTKYFTLYGSWCGDHLCILTKTQIPKAFTQIGPQLQQ